MWKNTPQKYGGMTKLLHWLSATAVIGLFASGYWMIDLDYYSQWYQTAPHWHQSAGILLFTATLLRIVWRGIHKPPAPVSGHSDLVNKIARGAHLLLYVLLLVIMVNGYLISTADDKTIEIFNWFELPSLGMLFDKQEDISGGIHKYGAYFLLFIAFIHALGAIKHHFIDKDETLMRMIK